MEVFVNVVRKKQPVESVECNTQNEHQKIMPINLFKKLIISSLYHTIIVLKTLFCNQQHCKYRGSSDQSA